MMAHQQDYSKQKNVLLKADDVIIFTTYHIYYDFLAIALTEHVANTLCLAGSLIFNHSE